MDPFGPNHELFEDFCTHLRMLQELEPHKRLGQILSDVLGSSPGAKNLYYVGDKVLVEALQAATDKTLSVDGETD